MKNFIPLLLATFVVGCTGFSTSAIQGDSIDQATDDRLDSLYQLNAWAIKGRIAIQAEKEGVTATLHWAQIDDRYQMRFIAPLGQGTYELRGSNHQVSLQTAENKLYVAQDPESLLMDNLGWKVPLGGLKYWVRGLPEPGVETENIVRDAKGRITDMEQSGWRISILRYTEIKDFELPGKLFLQNDRFKLRLVIQGWRTIT